LPGLFIEAPANVASRHTAHDLVRLNILRHDGPCGNHRTVIDVDSAHHKRVPAYPYIATDRDRPAADAGLGFSLSHRPVEMKDRDSVEWMLAAWHKRDRFID